MTITSLSFLLSPLDPLSSFLMPFFVGARNVLVSGGIYQDFSHNGTSGMHYLYQSIATSAIHDSNERRDPPRCHPETRKKILEDIINWIKNPDRKKEILRLSGSAGAGKSAILQTIAELCESNGLLAASFFFSRESDECNSGKKLFTTLAYQLAMSIPQLQEQIDLIIKLDPGIVKKSMEKQLKKLIFEPMSKLLKQGPLPASPRVIVIDGLDECIEEQQADILQLILEATKHPSFPFCIIVASRPEFTIASHFESPEYRKVTWTMYLDSDKRDTKEDIRAYLRSEFRRIHDNPIHGMHNIEKPWPSEYTIDKLVGRSSGQFVYASTVLKFVDDPDCAPSDQLRIIMNLLRGHPGAFLNLDKLYKDILEKCPNQERTLEVLGYLIAMTQAADAYSATWGTPLNTSILMTVIDQFLGLNPGDSFRSLRRLQSLISITSSSHNARNGSTYVSGPTHNVKRGSLDDQMASISGQRIHGGSGIKFHHASFADFLRKQKRSGQEFFIKVSSIHTRITRSCLRVMSTFSRAYLSENDYLVWVYAVLFWCYHCTKSQHQEDLINDLRAFNVCDDWILVQSLASPRVNEDRLRNALKTFNIQELKYCPAQGRWFVGKPDLQSMSKDLRSVTSWLKHSDNEMADMHNTVEIYSEAFNQSFAKHLARCPDRDSTLIILGILRSGEISEKMLLDFQAVKRNGLDSFLEPLKSFIYRYCAPNSECSSSSSSLNSLSSAQSCSDWRLGLKSELFIRFFESRRSSGQYYIGSKVHYLITSTLLEAVPQAILKEWNPYDYTQAWTFSLLRVNKYPEDLIEDLVKATAAYSSSPHLQGGLRRHHAKRVLGWLKQNGPESRLSDLIVKWSSSPIWKSTWHVDQQQSPGMFPSPVLYELALVHPLDSIKNVKF